MDGEILISSGVVVDVESFSVFLAVELFVEFVGDALVVAALEWEEFASVVVSEADVICDGDSALNCVDECRKEGSGVEIRCLNEYGLFGMTYGREPGFILGVVDAAVIGSAEGFTIDHCYGKWIRYGERYVRDRLMAWWRRLRRSFAVVVSVLIEVSGDNIHDAFVSIL